MISACFPKGWALHASRIFALLEADKSANELSLVGKIKGIQPQQFAGPRTASLTGIFASSEAMPTLDLDAISLRWWPSLHGSGPAGIEWRSTPGASFRQARLEGRSRFSNPLEPTLPCESTPISWSPRAAHSPCRPVLHWSPERWTPSIPPRYRRW